MRELEEELTQRGVERLSDAVGLAHEPRAAARRRLDRKRGSREDAVTYVAPIAVALDAPSLDTAARWAGLVTPHVSTVKIGLELYLRYGPEAVASVRGANNVRVFLDLKLQ